MPQMQAISARDRILAYFRKYPRQILDGDEFMVVSGIQDWPRRVRELRVEYGWWIYSGMTFKQIEEAAADDDDQPELISLRSSLGIDLTTIQPDQYVLLREDEDREAAFRWNTLNDIRKSGGNIQGKIIKYLRKNVGKQVTGEELKYLADDKKEWARRVRELRTEHGWPISTRNSGRNDLPIGVYVLEEDRQAPEHDRAIRDSVRVAVLTRDNFRCVQCGWHRDMLSTDDPRKALELHHKTHHAHGGENSVDNLITLCNVHHDEIHRTRPTIPAPS